MRHSCPPSKIVPKPRCAFRSTARDHGLQMFSSYEAQLVGKSHQSGCQHEASTVARWEAARKTESCRYSRSLLACVKKDISNPEIPEVNQSWRQDGAHRSS